MAKKIIILASGGGSNAAKIIDYFKKKTVTIDAVLCNRQSAGVYALCKSRNVPCHWMTSHTDDYLLHFAAQTRPDLIVLAGYLKKIPAQLIHQFPNRIVNIHPALLPKFGGKGMYGLYVHKAVKAAGEKESGITIHYVNEHYDEGEVLFQAKVELDSHDSPEEIARKVLALEHQSYGPIIEKVLLHNG